MVELDLCDIRRGSKGAILVRVRSDASDGEPLPDAVFTFRRGEPQYEFWAEQLRVRQSEHALSLS